MSAVTAKAAASAPELVRLSAVEMARAVGRGELSSRELVLAHLARIDQEDGRIHAFTTVFREQALREADRADQAHARGETLGPLHGVPVTVKECFEVAGVATTLGISARRARTAAADAVAVRMLRDAGAVVLGHTNLSQFMLFAESRNPIYGQTANPFAADRTPGGSSGGEAAAIASGMSPFGIGTDIGGSIRIPAHFSGIAGLKPTLDRLPLRGYVSGIPGQEVIRGMSGPMARHVGDLSLLLSAFDPRKAAALDPRVAPVPWEDPAGVSLRGKTVGMYVDDGVLAPSPALVRGVERAARALEARGCRIVPFTPPGIPEAVELYLASLSSDGGETLRAALEGSTLDPVLASLRRITQIPAAVRHLVAHGAELRGDPRLAGLLRALGPKPVETLWALTSRIRAYRFTVLDAMDAAGVDALLCPPFATPAVPHGGTRSFTLAASWTILFNVLQFPAGIVPVTRVRPDETSRAGARTMMEKLAAKVDATSAGLPVGVQIAARPWHDATVLALMGAVEAEVAGDPDYPLTPVP